MSIVSALFHSRSVFALGRVLRAFWTGGSPDSCRSPDAFDACLAFVLAEEGGFADDPRDSGGPTKYGITLATLRASRCDPALGASDIRTLDRTEAGRIYRARYWNAVRGPDLPRGIDLMAFDFGVNAGPGRAVKMLQRELGVPADGVVGPVTLAALQGREPRALIDRLAEARLAYYESLPGFAHFGAGWTARTRRARDAALRMAAG